VRDFPSPLSRRLDRVWYYWLEIIVVLLVVAAAQISLDGGRSDRVRGIPVRLDTARLVPGAVAEAHSLDAVSDGGATYAIAPGMAPVTVSRGMPLQIAGWAVDRTASRPSYAVFVTLGSRLYADRTGLPRDDVATSLRNQEYERAGFSLDLPANALPLGPIQLVVHGVSADGSRSYQLDPPIPLRVTP
jgi:hypothetical protein